MISFPNRAYAIAIGIFSLSVFCASNSAAAVYKWVDENGNTVYSQTPPPSGTNGQRLRDTPPPPVDPNEAMQTLRKRADEFSKRRDERLEIEEKGEEAAAQAKRNREICAQLRKNLTALQSGKQVREQGQDGQYTVLNDEGRQQRVKKTQARMQKECNNES